MELEEDGKVSIATNVAENQSVDEAVPGKTTSTTTKLRRRCYEEAFHGGQEDVDDDLESHIVPQGSGVAENDTSTLMDYLIGETEKKADLKSLNSEEKKKPKTISCQVPSCLLTFTSDKEYQKHYGSKHMHACAFCKKSLPSYHILDLHLLESHDTLFALMAENKPMYRCFLETCKETFQNPEERKGHCMSVHNFPEKFKFWVFSLQTNSYKSKGKSKGKHHQSHQTSKKDSNRNSNGAERRANDYDDSKATDLLVELKSDATMDEGTNSLLVEKPEVNQSTSKDKRSTATKSCPKHISFGHVPHRVFRNKFAFGIDKRGKSTGDSVKSENSMDLSEIQEALVSSSSTVQPSSFLDPKP